MKKLVLKKSTAKPTAKKLVLAKKPAPVFKPNQFKTPKSKGARAKIA
jgi:hypothetical protein